MGAAPSETAASLRSNWMRLLYPQSIALVGASDSGISSGHVVRNLRACGYAGALVPVNPRHDTVFGLPAFPTLRDAPCVDAALLLVGREHVEEAVDDGIAGNVGGMISVSGGFRESGEAQWAEAERRIAAKTRAAGIPFLGPNCLGLMALPARAMMTIAPYPWPLEDGSVALLLQSGGQLVASARYMNYLGAGVRWGFSLGNALGAGFADILSVLAEDREVRECALLVEEIPDWATFRAAVRQAQSAGKWIGAIVIGRTLVGQRAAQTHTGALVLQHNVLTSGFEQLGIATADTLGALLAAAALHARFGPARPGGVAIAGVSGGGGGLAGDLALSRRLQLAALSPDTASGIRSINADIRPDNPLDIVNGPMEPKRFRAVFERYLREPAASVGLYLPSQGIPDGHSPAHLELIDNVADVASGGNTPVVISSIVFAPIPESHRERLLARRNVALLPSIEEAMEALRLWLGRTAAPAAADVGTDTRIGKEGTDMQPAHEAALKALLARCGCGVPEGRVLSLDAARQLVSEGAEVLPQRPSLPIVVKGIGRRIFHKARLGFVRLGITDPGQLREALREMLASPHADDIEAFLLERELEPGQDVMVSLVREPLGVVVALSAGGAQAGEVGSAAWFGIEPTPEELLAGAQRILEPGRENAARALAHFTHRALEVFAEQRFSLLELNPVRVLESGQAIVLDAVANAGDEA